MVFESELKRAGGRRSSLRSRPLRSITCCLSLGGRAGGVTSRSPYWILGFKICFSLVSNSSFKAKGSRLS